LEEDAAAEAKAAATAQTPEMAVEVAPTLASNVTTVSKSLGVDSGTSSAKSGPPSVEVEGRIGRMEQVLHAVNPPVVLPRVAAEPQPAPSLFA
jgi:hypothetical protein